MSIYSNQIATIEGPIEEHVLLRGESRARRFEDEFRVWGHDVQAFLAECVEVDAALVADHVASGDLDYAAERVWYIEATRREFDWADHNAIEEAAQLAGLGL